MKIKIFSAHVPTYFGALHSTHTNYKSTLVVFLAALHLDTCLICTLRWTWVVQLCSQALKPIHKQQQHVMKSRWKTKPVCCMHWASFFSFLMQARADSWKIVHICLYETTFPDTIRKWMKLVVARAHLGHTGNWLVLLLLCKSNFDPWMGKNTKRAIGLGLS